MAIGLFKKKTGYALALLLLILFKKQYVHMSERTRYSKVENIYSILIF